MFYWYWGYSLWGYLWFLILLNLVGWGCGWDSCIVLVFCKVVWFDGWWVSGVFYLGYVFWWWIFILVLVIGRWGIVVVFGWYLFWLERYCSVVFFVYRGCIRCFSWLDRCIFYGRVVVVVLGFWRLGLYFGFCYWWGWFLGWYKVCRVFLNFWGGFCG